TSTFENPWKLLFDDFCWIFIHSYDVIVEFVLRNSIFAVCFSNERDDVPKSEVNLAYPRNWICILYQLILFILTLPIALVYPLFASNDSSAWKVRPPSLRDDDHDNEKWFFINGIVVDYRWLDENCKYLEKRFNRGVTGIHNTTYGVFWDLVETIFVRSFDIDVSAIRLAAENILPELKNKKIETVRLIAHSEGGAMANLIMRKLYMELSLTDEAHLLKKLEVYTFANASREFINPNGLVRRIEHYANKRDPVAMIGVLSNMNNVRFQGDIFVNESRNDGKGHLLNTFYSLNASDYNSQKSVKSLPTLLNLPGFVANLPINA
ncbi:17205_t:CDS:1, partial [Dentiscutata erythropus]